MSDAFTNRIPPIRRGGLGPGNGYLEADLLPKSGTQVPRKAREDNTRIRTKTDTGRRGEYPQALERTVLKELGNLTP